MDRCGHAMSPETEATRLRRRLITLLAKDEAAFEALSGRLSAAMTRAWAFGCEDAFRRALNILRGLDPKRFSREDEARLLAAIEQEIGNDAMRAALEGPVITLPAAIYQAEAMAAARAAAGLDYAFGVRDEAALDLLRRFDLHWIGRHWDTGTRAAVTGAVAEFFENGWTYETLAERLKAAFDGIEARGMAYWQLTADTIATKTRELGRVAGYEQAGVRYLEVRAHIDERTTPICRSMHGRLIRLETVTRQRDRYLEAIGRGHMEAAKAAWPMWDASVAFSGGTRTLPENVGLPPYHFRCRTVTVAYLGEDPERFALDFGAGVSDEARAAIEALSAAEHGRRAETFRRQAGAERLAWDDAHLRQDLRKSALAILRHARREFGIAGEDAAALEEYVRLSQRVVEMGEHLAVQVHRGRLQYVFGSRLLGAVAVVDWESAALRGLYGHRKSPGAFDRAWTERYAREGAQIVRREAKTWKSRLTRWIRWR